MLTLLLIYTRTQTHKHINSALGSICGQSRCRLNADKAAAIGAEMIAVHARGLFLTQFRQQKTAVHVAIIQLFRDSVTVMCQKNESYVFQR